MTQHQPRQGILRPSEQTMGVLLVVISAAGFGSGALFVQPLYAAGMEPLPVLFWRFGTAALFSWGFLLMAGRARSSVGLLSRRRVAVLLFLGALFVGNSYAYIASLEVVPITLSSIITYLYPAFVAVLATRLVRRLEGRRAWVALGISLLGVALAVGGIPQGELPPLWGLALAFANPLIYALWIVLSARLAGDRPNARPSQGSKGSDGNIPPALDPPIELPPADAEAVSDGPDPLPASAIMISGTAGVYAGLVLLTGGSISPFDVPAGSWMPLLGIGLVATTIALQTFYAGLKRIGGARAALISTVEPVYTIVLAMLLFGERLTTMQLLGGALVIGAVILAETGRGTPRSDEPDTVGTTVATANRVDDAAPAATPPR